MSTEPIHRSDPASPEAPTAARSRPARRGGLDPEFEEFLCEAVEKGGGISEESPSLRAWLDLAEAWKITKTLRECRGNRSAAARNLGIGRRTLYAKMEKLQIEPTWAMGERARS